MDVNYHGRKIIGALNFGKIFKRDKKESTAPSKHAADGKVSVPASPSHGRADHPSGKADAEGRDHASKTKPADPQKSLIGQILVRKHIITESELQLAMEKKKQEPDKYLGQILSEMGCSQSKIMHGIYFSNKRKKFGEILVDLNIISNEQLHDLLAEQKALKQRGIFKYLGALLIQEKILSEKNYMNALSAHFSMPIVSLKDHVASPELQKTVGEKFALRHGIVVLENSDQELTVALAEPHLSVFDHLEKSMPKGKQIRFCLAKASEIEEILDSRTILSIAMD